MTTYIVYGIIILAVLGLLLVDTGPRPPSDEEY